MISSREMATGSTYLSRLVAGALSLSCCPAAGWSCPSGVGCSPLKAYACLSRPACYVSCTGYHGTGGHAPPTAPVTDDGACDGNEECIQLRNFGYYPKRDGLVTLESVTFNG